MVNTNVAASTDSTRFVTGSRVNSRSRRGENCCDASCSVTTVTVKVSVVAVITDAAITWSIVDAASTPPGHTSVDAVPGRGRSRARGSATTSATTLLTSGHSQSGDRERSALGVARRVSAFTVRAPAGRSPPAPPPPSRRRTVPPGRGRHWYDPGEIRVGGAGVPRPFRRGSNVVIGVPGSLVGDLFPRVPKRRTPMSGHATRSSIPNARRRG